MLARLLLVPQLASLMPWTARQLIGNCNQRHIYRPWRASGSWGGIRFLGQYINRGGLVKPTDFLHNFAVHCWRVFEELWNTPNLKSKFLLCTFQRNVYCKILDRATCNEKYTCNKFMPRPCCSTICVANLAKQLTNTANQTLHGPSAKKRKIAKLTTLPAFPNKLILFI